MRIAELRPSANTASRTNHENQSNSSLPLFLFPTGDVFLFGLNKNEETLSTLIETGYHRLTPAERKEIFRQICSSSSEMKHVADYRLLKARFNPANQYRVKVIYGGKEELFECFKYEGNYHTGKQLYIKASYIKEVAFMAPQGDKAVH